MAAESTLSAKARPDDVIVAFQILLNRKLKNQVDIDFYSNLSIYQMLRRISNSVEFRQRILPQLMAPEPTEDWARKPCTRDALSWLERHFPQGGWENSLSKAAILRMLAAQLGVKLSTIAPVTGAKPPFLVAVKGDGTIAIPAAPAPVTEPPPVPPVAAPAGGVVAQKLVPVPPTRPMPVDKPARKAGASPDDILALHRLLTGQEGRAQAADAAGTAFPTLARQLALSSGGTWLGAMLDGAPLPQEQLFGPLVPADQLHLVNRLLFGQTVQARHVAVEPWALFLLRLLLRRDSILWLDGSAFTLQASESDAGPRLAKLRDLLPRAVEAVSTAHPIVGHPVFTAPATAAGVDGLFRFILGRPPGERDNLASSAADGYLACLRRFFLAPEFEREVVNPLRAGKPLRHQKQDPLSPAALEALRQIFGRPIQPVSDWAGDLLQFAFNRTLLSGVFPPSQGGAPAESREAYIEAVVRSMASQAASRGGRALAGRLELREGRRFRLELPAEAEAVGRLTLEAPRSLAALPAVTFSGSPKQAVFPLPVLERQGFTFRGAITLNGDETEQFPLYGQVSGEVVQDTLKKLLPEIERSHFLASRGRGREAVNLLLRILPEVPVVEQGWRLLAECYQLSGQAEALEEALPQAELHAGQTPEMIALKARLALARGDWPAAASLLERLPEKEPALQILAMAASQELAGRYAVAGFAGLPGWLLGQLLAFLRDPGRPAVLLSGALSNLPAGPERGAVAALMAEAMALRFVPAGSMAEFLRDCDRLGLLDAPALAADMAKRNRLHLLLPGLVGLSPERFRDGNLLLAIARLADQQGQHEKALSLAEKVLSGKPDDFDALNLAANMHRRLRRIDQAIGLMERALAVKPEDARLRERLLAAELDAIKHDPLRPKERADTLLDWLMRRQQKALFEAPASIEARFDYARAAMLNQMYEEAIIILEQLSQERPEWKEPRLTLLRIAQLRGDEPAVLRWFETMSEEERDPRLILAALKSMRALGEFEKAEALLARYADIEDVEMRREAVRSFFFVGDFAQAAEMAERYLKLYPRDLELRLLTAAAYQELGRHELAFFHVSWAYMNGGMEAMPLEMPLFLYAVAHKSGDTDMGLSHLGPMFARVGAQAVRLDRRYGGDPFDALVGGGVYPAPVPGVPQPVFDGPKVSVIMTSHNVEKYLGTAVRSILQQSYRNLELIIVDDASTDSTPDLLLELERTDPRIKVILKSTNDGTYVSKNLGLLQAQGEIIALQDSDDWSHPDRIACSVGVLMRHPEVMGLTTDWLRMTTAGDMVIKAGGQISHRCCISLVFRRAPVMEKVGFFDSVRIAADLEFIQRMTLVFGVNAVPRLRWPLLFGRARSDSLTASEEFGMSRTGFTEPRQIYHDESEKFHARIVAGSSAYLSFPLRQREFDAPAIILPSKGE